MCKDCGCSISKNHDHMHTHADGTTHAHAHDHDHAHSHGHSHDHSHHEHANPTLNDKKTIDVISKILSANDEQAQKNRAWLDRYKILALNLMSSPGSGKTTLLEATIKSGEYKIGVVEGDLETNQDANRIIKAGGKAHQISTGQACHLDAFMVHDGLHHLPLSELDVVFVENVGNLVCPASYDVGTHINVVLISVPEGDDKVAKYPVMFRSADVVIISKIDLLPYFDFDVQKVKDEARKLNPKVDIIEIDSKNGDGVRKWLDFIKYKKEYR